MGRAFHIRVWAVDFLMGWSGSTNKHGVHAQGRNLEFGLCAHSESSSPHSVHRTECSRAAWERRRAFFHFFVRVAEMRVTLAIIRW
jgi:hypothetical protein